MKVYIASFSNQSKAYGNGYHQEAFYTEQLKLNNRLLSYYAINIINHKESMESYNFYKEAINPISLFLDSGAYSAWSQNIDININEYIKFIKDNQESIGQYAVLDVIGDAQGTLNNQRYMEAEGLNPIPCFHYGEDEMYLREYLKQHNYIALGGMVKRPRNQVGYWLGEIWEKYFVNRDGTAKLKIHGFGMTSVSFMRRYPWHSVDSTSWVLTGRFGCVYCDIGDYNKVAISNKGNVEDSAHYYQLGKVNQKIIREYFTNLGEGYTIEELANDYKKRDEVNILYFLKLEKELSQTPVKFIQIQTNLF